MYNKLPERLKKLRNDREISQAKIAPMFDVRQQSYAAWETGETQPDVETLIKLAIFFDVTVDYLTGASDEIVKPAKAPKDDMSGAYDEPAPAPRKKVIG
jgi:transcriptional regulator with XRE-family HTH domain